MKSTPFAGQPTWPDPLRPGRFEWGCATSAFQIEGAHDLDGKVPSNWDVFCAQSGRIKDASTGQVACDHVHRMAKDVALMAELGFQHYRFSIAWPRVMTLDNRPNAKGFDVYKRLLDLLHARSITPNATLFHWDLPAHLSGGWLSEDTAKRFADYAQTVAKVLGDRLPRVATLNEPWCSAILGHDLGVFAPGGQSRSEALKAAYHLMLAHGLGAQAYRSVCPDVSMGIVLNPEQHDPLASPDPVQAAANAQAAQLADMEHNDCYLNPLAGQDWPAALYAQMTDQDAQYVRQGFATHRAVIGQSLDFLGINYYKRSWVKAPETTAEQARGFALCPVPAGLPITSMGWEIYPQGLPRLLKDMKAKWPLPPIWITENGIADNTPIVDGECNDAQRCEFLDLHLHAVAQAISQGFDIRGYYAWSLLDNFEWAHGYTERFGLVHVDYATQQRTPKRSAQRLQAWLRG